ncbi:MFS transporter [Actinomadura algeriensis]|uniref:MFS family permease n=1 Tax=Actinomadura algeriensis TaxID=1679523 RepID=A0ABR9K0C7_9ACTN|nr:MFS transporter [Actinomadura algeriensis]MBE1536287.1 MFS family permease [Actinomadura algeriensis]
MSYSAVLRAPHARRTFTLTLLGRLSYATAPFSLTLALVATTGSYTTTGAVTALYGLTICALSPLRARLIDRHGPRRVLPPLTAAHALTLAALALTTWRPGTPLATLTALAITAGATAPPLGVVMRTHWNDLLPDKTLLHRALSLDGVAEELLYVTGPLLAGLIAATATPSLGIAAGVPLIIIGTIGLTTSPALPRTRPTHEPAARRPALPLAPALAAATIGAVLGSIGLLAVAHAHHHGRPAATAAWIEAALAAGSALGGLAYGALTWRSTEHARLTACITALGAALAAAALAPTTLLLTALIATAGIFIAPATTTAYLIADAAAPPQARVRTAARVNTALNLGATTGTAATGALLDVLPLPLCFLVTALPAITAALLLRRK